MAPGLTIVRWDAETVGRVARHHTPVLLKDFPLAANLTVDLDLTPFRVAGLGGVCVLGSLGAPDRPLDFDPSTMTFLRGTVAGRSDSHVFLTLSDRVSTGYVDLGGGAGHFLVSSKGGDGESLGAGRMSVFPAGEAASLPPGVALCGTDAAHGFAGPVVSGETGGVSSVAGIGTSKGMRTIELAIETDFEVFELFGDATATCEYVTSMYAAVSDIYTRDVNARFELTFVRIWDNPNDLFNDVDPSPLFDFVDYWNANMGHVQRDTAQLFSARRDYPFGGQAFLNSMCSDFHYGVVGYVLGVFPDPTKPSPLTYDVAVTAHELGHSSGTGHTHSSPNFLDTCDDPNTTPRRGSIMSYCGQTWSGQNANRDLYFHTRIVQNMRAHLTSSACVILDCNMNNIADATEIGQGQTPDTNGNGIPDVCEDCDGDGILDPVEIAGASADLNGNTIPDECETDCNGNGSPDDRDINVLGFSDAYGNGVPDVCETDCNGNGTSDYTEIQLNMPLDIDRNAVLDSCQDCDGDGTVDHVELARAHNLWIASGKPTDPLREFFVSTGVLAGTSSGAGSTVAAAQDLIVTSDGRVLVSAAGDNRVMQFSIAGVFTGNLVDPGAGGLSFPAGLVMTGDGTLLVASRNTNSVLAYDGTTGVPQGAFVHTGSGGLAAPFGLAFGPNGNLFVTTGTNEVVEFNGVSGAFVRVFVSHLNNGGLDQPKGLAFKPDGNLLVASFGTDEVLEFDGTTGAPLGKWANVGTATRLTQDSPWCIRIGPNGNVFVSRTGTEGSSSPEAGAHDHDEFDDVVQGLHLTDARMYEFDVCTGDFRGTHIGGNDHGLDFPTGFDFIPGFEIDCNLNQLPDSCDIASGFSTDTDASGVPDECEIDCNGNGRFDRLDLFPFGASIDCNCNKLPDECDIASGGSGDVNGNGVPDECEADCNGNGIPDAVEIANMTAADCNNNGVPDECEPDDDCNGNGKQDICDLADGSASDCNRNGVPDTCDAAGGGLVLAADFEAGLPPGWTRSGIFQVGSACPVAPVCDGGSWAYAGNAVTCTYGDNQAGQLISPTFSLAETTAELRYCSLLNSEAGFDFAEVFVNGVSVSKESGASSVWEDRVIDLSAFKGAVDVTIEFRFSSDVFLSGTLGWQVDNVRVISGSPDCDGDGTPDECEADCDGSGVADVCEILDGILVDVNGNLVPDICECPRPAPLPDPIVATKVRYLSVRPLGGAQPMAMRVTNVTSPPPFDVPVMWVGQPRLVSQLGGKDDATPPTLTVATLECQPVFADWSGVDTVHIYHGSIVPSSVYHVESVDVACDLTNPSTFSVPVEVALSGWGDVGGTFDSNLGRWNAPDGRVDVAFDVVAILDGFANRPGAPMKPRTDLEPAVPDQKINITDVVSALDAFSGQGYPFVSPDTPCP